MLFRAAWQLKQKLMLRKESVVVSLGKNKTKSSEIITLFHQITHNFLQIEQLESCTILPCKNNLENIASLMKVWLAARFTTINGWEKQL